MNRGTMEAVREALARFEGESDPDDEAALFALRSGPRMEPAHAAVIHRLPPEPVAEARP